MNLLTWLHDDGAEDDKAQQACEVTALDFIFHLPGRQKKFCFMFLFFFFFLVEGCFFMLVRGESPSKSGRAG